MSKHAKLSLGEIALRVNDLDRMQAFYESVVGLELIRRFSAATFLKIGDGYAGHTQIIAMFDRSADPEVLPVDPTRTSVDHIAFSVTQEDFEREKARLETLGLPMTFSDHAWIQWRSLYITDPEGNLIEWVYFDPELKSDSE